MTREKKMLIKKIDKLMLAKDADYAMDGSGECGKFIEKAYAPLINPLIERLSELQKGNCIYDPFWIARNCPTYSVATELPFN